MWGGTLGVGRTLSGGSPEELGRGQIPDDDLLVFRVGLDSPWGEVELQDPSLPQAPLGPLPGLQQCLHMATCWVLLGFVPFFKLADFNVRYILPLNLR